MKAPRKPAPPAQPAEHEWQFVRSFRRNAFSAYSKLPAQRLREAIAEIKAVAKTNQVLAAEGAILLIERMPPAFAQLDGSTPPLGSTLNKALEGLAKIIGSATVPPAQRKEWLRRLQDAQVDDDMPVIEALGDLWGTICGSKEQASESADHLLPATRHFFSEPRPANASLKLVSNCLSALRESERYADIITLTDHTRPLIWSWRLFRIQALAALGRPDDAIACAEADPSLNIRRERAALCESILINAGRSEEADTRFAEAASPIAAPLTIFRSLRKRYPKKPPSDLIQDFQTKDPTSYNEWFAIAFDEGLFDLCLSILKHTRIDPDLLAHGALRLASTAPAIAHQFGHHALQGFLTQSALRSPATRIHDLFTALFESATSLHRLPDLAATSHHLRTAHPTHPLTLLLLDHLQSHPAFDPRSRPPAT